MFYFRYAAINFIFRLSVTEDIKSDLRDKKGDLFQDFCLVTDSQIVTKS